MYSFGGDFRFSTLTTAGFWFNFSSSVLFVSIISPSSVEITCCCFRGFFLGEAPGGNSPGGSVRLLDKDVKAEDAAEVREGTADTVTGCIISIGSTSSFILISNPVVGTVFGRTLLTAACMSGATVFATVEGVGGVVGTVAGIADGVTHG